MKIQKLCSDGDLTSLYRELMGTLNLRRSILRNIQGHYTQAKVQMAYMQCHGPFDVEKYLCVQEATNWRKP